MESTRKTFGSAVGAALAAAAALAAPGAAAAAGCTLKQVAALPVTMAGRQPVVHGSIDGEAAVFLVDTGAFMSVLSPETVARRRLGAWRDARMTLRGIAGTADARRTTVDALTAGDGTFDHVDFLVAEGAGPGVDGVLGQNVLGRYDAEYDLANGVVRLIEPKGCGQADMLAYWAEGPVAEAPLLGSMEPVSPGYGFLRPSFSAYYDRQVSAYATLNGKRVRALFDTGSAVSNVTLAAAAGAGVTRDSAGVVRAPSSRGFGDRSAPNWLAPFGSFALGGEEVRNTSLQIGRLNLGENQMVLGADFFLAHRVYVSKLQHKLYFTYNGGPVFRQGGPTAAPPPPEHPVLPAPGKDPNLPVDASGYLRRGAASLARGALNAAVDDFSRALLLAPRWADAYFDRAAVYAAARQPDLALADYDRGLKLRPDDPFALAGRAEVRLDMDDRLGARADLDAASRLPSRGGAAALQIAALYEQADVFDEAVARYDRWLRDHPKGDGRAAALGGRCRARALSRRELDLALQDCDAALRLRPDDPVALESRALAHLARGEDVAAIADADAAIAVDPKSAWALHGRALAELRRGLTAQGEADLRAAASLEPRQAARARRLGFLPDAAAG